MGYTYGAMAHNVVPTHLHFCLIFIARIVFQYFVFSCLVIDLWYMILFHRVFFIGTFQSCLLQAARYRASSPDNRSSVKSCLWLSIHIRFGLPSGPGHIYHHQCFTQIMLFYSRYTAVQFNLHSSTLLHISLTSGILLIISFIGLFMHPSQYPNLRHIQFFFSARALPLTSSPGA